MVVCGLRVTRPLPVVQDYKMAAKVRDAIQQLEMRDPLKLLERELREAIAEQRFQVKGGREHQEPIATKHGSGNVRQKDPEGWRATESGIPLQ